MNFPTFLANEGYISFLLAGIAIGVAATIGVQLVRRAWNRHKSRRLRKQCNVSHLTLAMERDAEKRAHKISAVSQKRVSYADELMGNPPVTESRISRE